MAVGLLEERLSFCRQPVDLVRSDVSQGRADRGELCGRGGERRGISVARGLKRIALVQQPRMLGSSPIELSLEPIVFGFELLVLCR
jgi:hypothetical protein